MDDNLGKDPAKEPTKDVPEAEAANTPEVSQNPQNDFEPGDMNLPGEPETYRQPVKKQNKAKPAKKTLLKILIIIVVLGVVAGLGYGGFKLLQDSEQTQESAPTSQQPSTETIGALPLSETYTSDSLRLDFKYPSGWQVNEADRGIRIESPDFTYSTTEGEEVTGNFRIYIRKGAREVDGEYLGRAFASQPSQKIAYVEPTSVQLEETLITPFGLDTPDNFALFIVQGTFELKKGDTLGPDYAKEPDAYLIIGGYSSADKQEDLDTNQVSLDRFDQTTEYLTAVEVVRSLQLR